MASATIDLGLNATPFEQGIARAEKSAQSFSGRLQNLFRRSPTARAQRALGGFLGDLAAGDVSTALTGIASRLHGVGLAAGIGLGAAVVVFQKAKEQIDAVDKAISAVHANLALPLSAQSALGPEGIRSELEKTVKAGQELSEKRQGFFQKIREAAEAGRPDEGHVDYKTLQWVDEHVDKTPTAAAAQTGNRKRQYEITKLIVDADNRDVAVQKEFIDGSERVAELAKIHREEAEKRAKIRLGPTRNFGDVVAKVSGIGRSFAEEDIKARAAEKKFDLARLQEETEKRILDLHATSLTKDEQGLVTIKERIALLHKELSLTSDPLKRAGIQNKIKGLENQDAMARYQESLKPEAQKRAEKEAQKAYQRWVEKDARNQGLENTHRDMSGNLIGGTDPITGEYVNKPRISALDMPMKSAFTDDYSLKSGRVGDTWTDQNKPGGPSTSTLGKIGVLDRIESKIDGIGANR